MNCNFEFSENSIDSSLSQNSNALELICVTDGGMLSLVIQLRQNEYSSMISSLQFDSTLISLISYHSLNAYGEIRLIYLGISILSISQRTKINSSYSSSDFCLFLTMYFIINTFQIFVFVTYFNVLYFFNPLHHPTSNSVTFSGITKFSKFERTNASTPIVVIS